MVGPNPTSFASASRAMDGDGARDFPRTSNCWEVGGRVEEGSEIGCRPGSVLRFEPRFGRRIGEAKKPGPGKEEWSGVT
eukprot:5004834-Heterocapsa_arctica.AAC.1